MGNQRQKLQAIQKIVNLSMAKSKKTTPDSKPGARQSDELPAKDSLADENNVVKGNEEDEHKAPPTSFEDLQEDDRELGGEG